MSTETAPRMMIPKGLRVTLSPETGSSVTLVHPWSIEIIKSAMRDMARIPNGNAYSVLVEPLASADLPELCQCLQDFDPHGIYTERLCHEAGTDYMTMEESLWFIADIISNCNRPTVLKNANVK